MPSDNARRGRPRGSGLDDSAQLRQIAELLDADPTLKPTTAIKAVGVSDPSTIRRLREKLKDDALARPPRVVSPPAPAPRPTSEGADAQSGLSQALPSAPAAAHSGGQAEAGVSDAPAPPPLNWFTQWCALGLYAVSSAVEAQMAVMDDLVKVPPVESALRQQLLFNEVAKAFCPKRSDVRTTLH